MKKIILGTFTAILSSSLLFGCGTSKNDEEEPNSTEAPSEHKKEQEKNQNDNHSKE